MKRILRKSKLLRLTAPPKQAIVKYRAMKVLGGTGVSAPYILDLGNGFGYVAL
jgi:hypothetical protein